jgi:hypothetical protein
MNFSDFSINLAAQKNKLAVQNYEFSCPNLRQPKKLIKKKFRQTGPVCVFQALNRLRFPL